MLLVWAPTICDPFNPCGCASPYAEMSFDFGDGPVVISYEERGFGVYPPPGCGKVYDLGKVVIYCYSGHGFRLYFCTEEAFHRANPLVVCQGEECSDVWVSREPTFLDLLARFFQRVIASLGG